MKLELQNAKLRLFALEMTSFASLPLLSPTDTQTLFHSSCFSLRCRGGIEWETSYQSVLPQTHANWIQPRLVLREHELQHARQPSSHYWTSARYRPCGAAPEGPRQHRLRSEYRDHQIMLWCRCNSLLLTAEKRWFCLPSSLVVFFRTNLNNDFLGPYLRNGLVLAVIV